MNERGHGWIIFSAVVLGVGAAAAVAAISAVWWMPYYPLWSITYVALGALVIYALGVYAGPRVPEYVWVPDDVRSLAD